MKGEFACRVLCNMLAISELVIKFRRFSAWIFLLKNGILRQKAKKCIFFQKKVQKNLQVKKKVVPLQPV